MKEAAAALPFPVGKGTKDSFFLLVEEMRERARAQGGDKHRVVWPLACCPLSSWHSFHFYKTRGLDRRSFWY